MTCLDCGTPTAPSLIPVCAPCARLAVTLLGSMDARLALLEAT